MDVSLATCASGVKEITILARKATGVPLSKRKSAITSTSTNVQREPTISSRSAFTNTSAKIVPKATSATRKACSMLPQVSALSDTIVQKELSTLYHALQVSTQTNWVPLLKPIVLLARPALTVPKETKDLLNVLAATPAKLKPQSWLPAQAVTIAIKRQIIRPLYVQPISIALVELKILFLATTSTHAVSALRCKNSAVPASTWI